MQPEIARHAGAGRLRDHLAVQVFGEAVSHHTVIAEQGVQAAHRLTAQGDAVRHGAQTLQQRVQLRQFRAGCFGLDIDADDGTGAVGVQQQAAAIRAGDFGIPELVAARGDGQQCGTGSRADGPRERLPEQGVGFQPDEGGQILARMGDDEPVWPDRQQAAMGLDVAGRVQGLARAGFQIQRGCLEVCAGAMCRQTTLSFAGPDAGSHSGIDRR